ncbi:MAG TPA: arginine repressor [Syntrophomonadaceae bacterium]|nr:arginine repressor [Syntrophomonadaceae bacterium]
MKSRRHFAIMDIISNQRVTTQEELGDALRNNGFKVTQATISRDIKELHIIKAPDRDGYYYAIPELTNLKGSQERMRRVFQDSVIKLDYSSNIIVIKTMPGAAQSVASLIDTAEQPYILGSVAGDDTIFVVVKPAEAVEKVVEKYNRMIHDK